MADEVYANIREILKEFVNKKVVDITQHDVEEFKETHQSYVMLLFEDGTWLKFIIGDEGFHYGEG